MYLSMYVCMYACMHVCMFVCMYACMHVCMYACRHVCMYACMHVCMFTCMHVCMYVCMYVYTEQGDMNNYSLRFKVIYNQPLMIFAHEILISINGMIILVLDYYE